MKKILICLFAIMGVLTLTAQSVYENEVINNIMARRSIRQYLDKPVEHEKLAAVVQAGINAPSGMNRQCAFCWQMRNANSSSIASISPRITS